MTGSRASDFFDGYARDFSAIYGTRNTLPNRVVNRWLRKSMRLRYERTLAGCAPIEGKSVLDVGCGPGHYSVALAAKGARRVLGIDFAPRMIELAAERARASGVDDRCEFAVGDFLEFPLDGTFDHVVVMGFMDYIEDPARLIEKVRAVTLDRAFFSLPASGGLLAWQRRWRYRNRCELYLYERARVEELFAESKFERVEIVALERDFFVTACASRG